MAKRKRIRINSSVVNIHRLALSLWVYIASIKSAELAESSSFITVDIIIMTRRMVPFGASLLLFSLCASLTRAQMGNQKDCVKFENNVCGDFDPNFLCSGLEGDHRFLANALWVVFGFILFMTCFCITHDGPFGGKLKGYGLMKKWYPKAWETMDEVNRGDIASRLHSSLHAIVVLGNIPALASCGIWGDPLANNCRSVEVFFSITVGYFLFDFIVVLYYKMAFWQVFVIHHCCAISPYFINNFIPNSSNCNYLLGLFIQVEIATLVLNYQNLLEVTEQTNTPKYRVTFYGAYVTWILARLVLPIYIVVLMVDVVMPCYKTTWYAVVAYGCGFFVLTFCTIVFLFIMTPDVITHLRGPPLDNNTAKDFTPVDEAGDGSNAAAVELQETGASRKSWAPSRLTGDAEALTSEPRIHFRSRGASALGHV